MPLWDGRETPEEYEDRKRRNEEKAAEWEERQRLFAEKKRLWEEGEAVRQFNRGRMEYLIREAQSLSYALDFYSARAHQAMKSLQASAKEHRYVGRDHNHLNDEFWQASQEFYHKRDEHFLAQRRKNEEARGYMTMLVGNAEIIATNPTDFRDAHNKLEEITKDMAARRCAKEDSDYLWGKLKSIKNDFHEKWREKVKKEKEERETQRWTSKSVRGDYHVSGANNAHVTSKFSDGVKNPNAEGFISLKDSEGGKSSFTFNHDGTMHREDTKGGFKPSNWRDK